MTAIRCAGVIAGVIFILCFLAADIAEYGVLATSIAWAVTLAGGCVGLALIEWDQSC